MEAYKGVVNLLNSVGQVFAQTSIHNVSKRPGASGFRSTMDGMRMTGNADDQEFTYVTKSTLCEWVAELLGIPTATMEDVAAYVRSKGSWSTFSNLGSHFLWKIEEESFTVSLNSKGDQELSSETAKYLREKYPPEELDSKSVMGLISELCELGILSTDDTMDQAFRIYMESISSEESITQDGILSEKDCTSFDDWRKLFQNRSAAANQSIIDTLKGNASFLTMQVAKNAQRHYSRVSEVFNRIYG